MRTRLVKIGNSRGVRLSKTIIAQAGLTDEVELDVQEGAVVIARVISARSGWADAASQMQQRGEDRLLDEAGLTHFDEREWKW